MKYYKEFVKTARTMRNFNTFPIDKKTNSKKYASNYDKESDDILTFDIECSSGFVTKDGEVIGYEKGKSEDYWNSLEPVALCYIWQFSFNDEVFYGRYIEEFREVLDALPKNVHFIIYIHNLSYEFVTLLNILTFDGVFARQAHKPIYTHCIDYPALEFRCSYMLTRLSLDAWGDSLDCEKLHSLDYLVLRTPKTALTDKELDYCERDCQVVYVGIKKFRDKYKHIKDIPLTQTGEVRRVVKRIITKDKSLQKQIVKLLPENSDMYAHLKKAFAGGYTHANYTLSGRIFRASEMGHKGYAFDFSSSYPAVMCSELFPMTPFRKCEYDGDTDKWAYLMRVEFTNLEAKTKNHYISFSKIFNEKFKKRENGRDCVWVDNGRIIRTKGTFEMWITEQDYKIIKATYKGKSKVLECYKSRKAYLPKCFIEYILELYGNKTSLKNVVGKEELYTQSKQFINSLFGMSVTDLVQDIVEFDGSVWDCELTTVSDIEAYLIDLKEDNKNRTFLAYQWGVWITAYARKNLWDCIIPNDDDVIYCDTDSIKIREKVDFSWYNERISAKLKTMCDTLGIDFELTRPKDPKGKERPLGLFLQEDDWTEFITWGAKKYCYRDAEDGKLHLTVSGINKDAVLALNDNIENFTEDFVFDKDFQVTNSQVKQALPLYYDDKMGDDELRGVKKSLPKHLYKMPTVVWNAGQYDEYKSTYKCGINLRPTSYSMSLDVDYFDLLMLAISRTHLVCMA